MSVKWLLGKDLNLNFLDSILTEILTQTIFDTIQYNIVFK